MDITIIGTGNIASGIGTRPVDAGPLARAHELEALGYLHMAFQESLGSAIKVLP